MVVGILVCLLTYSILVFYTLYFQLHVSSDALANNLRSMFFGLTRFATYSLEVVFFFFTPMIQHYHQ